MWVAVLAAGMLAGSALMGTAGAAPAGPPGGLEVREQNVDENVDDAIRVHEQGVADVNVTNGSFDVNVDFPTNQDVTVTNTTPLSVDVDNWPTTQDVSAAQDGLWNVGVDNFPETQEVSGTVGISGTPDVNVVSMPSVTYSPAPATQAESYAFLGVDSSESMEVDPVLNASTINIQSVDDVIVTIVGSIGGEMRFGSRTDDFGDRTVTLVRPYPVRSIWVFCYQISDCDAWITLIGD
jgi:hypothetical protein